ncbi:MAG: adenylate/guanylate cyclase domain-containing protein [Pseudomonadota bacterium]
MPFFNIARRPAHKQLPQRVLQSIAAHRTASSKIISLISISLALIFFALYMLSIAGRTTEIRPMFEPVPWVLGFYLLFNCLRVWLAWRTQLPRWFLMIDSTVDIILLIGLIWSFQFSYDQSAGFVLKSPTLLYVFIFIALRALLLDPLYILIAGGAAVLGWAAIILLVLLHGADGMGTITRDYVTYMTSNAMLLGAEFDKLITIGLAAIILAIAIYRANTILHDAFQHESARHELSRFFDSDVADQISTHGEEMQAGRGEAIEASILNLDLRGFTKCSAQLKPDQVMRLLCDYQALIVPVIQRHHGTIDKFLGDGIMATFKQEPANAANLTNHCVHAMRAINELLKAAKGWDEARAKSGETPLSINMALATGTVMSGVVGIQKRVEYTVIGDAVNFSAKLEKHNKIVGSRALCDARSWDLAVEGGFSGDMVARNLPDQHIEGVAKPVDLVSLELGQAHG